MAETLEVFSAELVDLGSVSVRVGLKMDMAKMKIMSKARFVQLPLWSETIERYIGYGF